MTMVINNILCLPTSWAYKIYRRALQKDNGFAISWHANLAMPILEGSAGKLTPVEANSIADKLMSHLWNAKATYPI